MKFVITLLTLTITIAANATEGVYAFVRGDRQCPQLIDIRNANSNEMQLLIDQEVISVPVAGAKRDSIRTPNFNITQQSRWLQLQQERLKGEEFPWDQSEDDLKNLFVDFDFSENKFSSYVHYTFNFTSAQIDWNALSLIRSTPESDHVCEYLRAL